MVYQIIQVLLVVFLPWLLTKLTRRLGTENWLSPVVLCYLAGIALCNLTTFPLDNSLLLRISQFTIVVAIPLLLYSTDLLGWIKLAKTTILSFSLVIISVIIAAVITALLFKKQMENGWLLSGMLTGVYIGGTPNMNAVGIALEANEETFITLNAAEIVCGGVFLIFLTSFAHRFFGYFLPEFTGDKHEGVDEYLPVHGIKIKDISIALGLTAILVAASFALTRIIMGSIDKPGFLILMVSALGVIASFSDRIRKIQGAYETGDYLLLMFCVSIGMMADFGEIFTTGSIFIAFSAVTMLITIVLHTFLCRFFKIDRDTMMITLTAGFYGPPFIGQIAAVIKNRSLLFSGIATALVGIAIANFLGIAVGNILLEWLFKSH